MRDHRSLVRSLAAVLLVVHATAPRAAFAQCNAATQYTYTFSNACAFPIWIEQRSTGDSAAYPPQSGNWALSPRCTTNADCASAACDADSGQCACTTASDCSGGGACAADGKCATLAVFYMPHEWTSGTFWPRTGCGSVPPSVPLRHR
jgi:hypothetical protein